MATINYYLDKTDKKGLAPIHLRINCNGNQIKISTGQKVDPKDFDKKEKRLKAKAAHSVEVNHYLAFLKERAFELLNRSTKKKFTNKEIKETITDYAKNYKADHDVSIVKEQVPLYGRGYTFIDLFAGAGGFSEGFLQAELNNKYFDFRLANDINENCELTHVVRYNHQLGLDADFLCQDITEPDFLSNLLSRLGNKKVDVVCGGPPCQSFSLAGKRKKYDKKDDLFSHYLEVIKTLQPKYFVMENVKGILTKEKGKIKDRILGDIRSIVDIKELPRLERFIKKLNKTNQSEQLIIDCLIKRIDFERLNEKELEVAKESYIKLLDGKFKSLTPKIVDYKTSKTDSRISTIRHGFNLLLRSQQLIKLQRDVIKEKDHCNIDNDAYIESFTTFLSELDPSSIVSKIEASFELLKVTDEYKKECQSIIEALDLYISSFDHCVTRVKNYCGKGERIELDKLLDSIRLYRIEAPFVANSSNYGVPQNRERVLFIGCRKDQKLISNVPATVTDTEKVTVIEALHDLDFIGNDQEAFNYETTNLKNVFNGSTSKFKKLIRKRAIDGKNGKMGKKTYAEWSREGRLPDRLKPSSLFYVKSTSALENGEKTPGILHNHKTSKQNETVVKRLKIILESGDYSKAKEKLNECGLSSQKRNYNVLKPERQSPTVMTIPDDYVHYNSPRALTVREMARLQSFDDSFVFQGKRSTGGNKRKSEVPQFTLVGNAVPPLMARAVAMELLRNIK